MADPLNEMAGLAAMLPPNNQPIPTQPMPPFQRFFNNPPPPLGDVDALVVTARDIPQLGPRVGPDVPTQPQSIAVIGWQGVGKSTLINNVLGERILHVGGPLDIGSATPIHITYGPNYTATIEYVTRQTLEVITRTDAMNEDDTAIRGHFLPLWQHFNLEFGVQGTPADQFIGRDNEFLEFQGADELREEIFRRLNERLVNEVETLTVSDFVIKVRITIPNRRLFNLEVIDTPGYGDHNPLRHRAWSDAVGANSVVVVTRYLPFHNKEAFPVGIVARLGGRINEHNRLMIVCRPSPNTGALPNRDDYLRRLNEFLHRKQLTEINEGVGFTAMPYNEAPDIDQLLRLVFECQHQTLWQQLTRLRQLEGVVSGLLDLAHNDEDRLRMTQRIMEVFNDWNERIPGIVRRYREQCTINEETLRVAFREACLNLGQTSRGALPFATSLRMGLRNRDIHWDAAAVVQHAARRGQLQLFTVNEADLRQVIGDHQIWDLNLSSAHINLPNLFAVSSTFLAGAYTASLLDGGTGRTERTAHRFYQDPGHGALLAAVNGALNGRVQLYETAIHTYFDNLRVAVLARFPTIVPVIPPGIREQLQLLHQRILLLIDQLRPLALE